MEKDEQPNVDERVDRYILGKMSEQDQQAFEQACITDDLLREAYHDSLLTRFAIWQAGYKEQKSEFRELFKETKKKRRNFLTKTRRRISVAAIIVMLLGAGGVLWLQSVNPQTPLELFAANYERPRVPETLGENEEKILQDARNYFRNEEFKKASVSFASLLNDTAFSKASEAYFYLGISYLEIGELEKSVEALAKAELNPDQSEWYAALALVRGNNLDLARLKLTEITQVPNHYYREKAEKLLTQLD